MLPNSLYNIFSIKKTGTIVAVFMHVAKVTAPFSRQAATFAVLKTHTRPRQFFLLPCKKVVHFRKSFWQMVLSGAGREEKGGMTYSEEAGLGQWAVGGLLAGGG